MKERIKKILETKKYESMSLDELIDEYIMLLQNNSRKNLDDLLSEILILIQRYDSKLSRASLEEIAIAQAYSINSLPKNLLLTTLIYEKSLTNNTKLTIRFGAPDERGITAIEKKLLWINGNSNERTANKLREIFQDALRGKYTRVELLDKLREEFAGYKELEEHKLKAAADLNLRQARNMGTVARAIGLGDKYLQIVAKIDDKTTNICRSMHLRVIKVSDIEKQYDNLISAETIEDAKAASDLSRSNEGLWKKELPQNFGIPPYHFGCRTIVRQMSSIQVDEMQLDEFGREYAVNKNILEKIEFEHLSETKYNTPEELIKKTINNIEKEGVHINNPEKRVIYGRNGVLVVLDRNGKIETAYKPSAGLRGYLNTTGEIYYNEVRKSLFERVTKWILEN
ncbi:MAG: hypothetical protein LBH45_07255 [Campylobacteraceae bacterium]|jgi:hypothetical protein|nr:hypothetical protein [Campylobacteraceae bacterium]